MYPKTQVRSHFASEINMFFSKMAANAPKYSRAHIFASVIVIMTNVVSKCTFLGSRNPIKLVSS